MHFELEMFENRIEKFRFIGTFLQIFGGPQASRVRVSRFVGILPALLSLAESKGYPQSDFRRAHGNCHRSFLLKSS